MVRMIGTVGPKPDILARKLCQLVGRFEHNRVDLRATLKVPKLWPK